MPFVRPDPSPAAKSSSSSTNSDPVLKEIENYIPDSRDDDDSVDRFVEGEPEGKEEEPSTLSALFDSSVSRGISSYSRWHFGVLIALMEADAKKPSFTADFTTLKTQERDIIRGYKEGRMDVRWFEYLLSYPNFRVSLPPPGYLFVYT